MKTLLACLVVAAAAGSATAGPDFITPTPRAHALAASSTTSPIDPGGDVVFAHDSVALAPSAIAQIESAARWLDRHRRHKIVLEGHADSAGEAIYNEDLATRRAEIVRNHLVASGIPYDRIVLVIYGEAGARPDPHPLDRRVVLYASTLPTQAIIAAAFDNQALHAVWTHGTALFVETPAPRPREAVAER